MNIKIHLLENGIMKNDAVKNGTEDRRNDGWVNILGARNDTGVFFGSRCYTDPDSRTHVNWSILLHLTWMKLSLWALRDAEHGLIT